jgi:hypothetical protein
MTGNAKSGGLISGAEWRARHLPGHPFKVMCDPEVQQFVAAALKTMGFKAIAAACSERFGPERAPSKSAIQRYWIALRLSSRPVSTPPGPKR